MVEHAHCVIIIHYSWGKGFHCPKTWLKSLMSNATKMLWIVKLYVNWLQAFQSQIKKILMNILAWKYLKLQVVMMSNKGKCESKSCCHFNFGKLTWRTSSALYNNPLQWWRKHHETMFPIVTLLGQQILSISMFHIETKTKFSLSNVLTKLVHHFGSKGSICDLLVLYGWGVSPKYKGKKLNLCFMIGKGQELRDIPQM